MSNSALAPGVVLHSPKRDYTICSVLGQGGFGITYLVETPLKMENISFKGRFAVKEHFLQMLCAREEGSSNIHFLPNSTEEVHRSKRAFIAEAQRLQKLGINHHNIVEVNEVFEYNKTAYYVMEYIDGGSVVSFVKSNGGRLSWDDTVKLMRPICEAVAMLHRNKVAHYDIKPQNIMVQQEESGLRPVLIDFGLAKHYDGQGQATSSIAAAGYTPGYAPLEQYAGLRQFAPTADVYALSATICFCLTGHAPAKADELNLDELCDELLSCGVDEAVANVLLKALELRPVDRPADAGIFTAALFDGAPLQKVRKPRPVAQTPTEVTPVVNKPSDNVTPPAPIPVSDDNPEDEAKGKSVARWLIPVIIALLGVGVALFFILKDDKRTRNDDEEETEQMVSLADEQEDLSEDLSEDLEEDVIQAEETPAEQRPAELEIIPDEQLDETAEAQQGRTDNTKPGQVVVVDDSFNGQTIRSEVVETAPTPSEREKVYTLAMVEQKPEFPGGEQAVYKWLSDHISYPAQASEEGVQGRVIVEFDVSKTGAIENVRVVRGRHPALDKEAVRVVKSMPKWLPGRNDGQPVKVTYTLPIIFRL